MDNITHGTLGILAAILTAPPALRKKAALAGLIAAELPDLDIFIISPADPLLGLQMHRHFTHSLVMIPLLAALGVLLANALRRLFRRPPIWRGLWLPAAAAAATHGLCDTWTSYGTHLLWPFTDRRESWDLISVVDPLLTLPLLLCAILAWARGTHRPALCGTAWAALYLTLCLLQQHRAITAVKDYATTHGHTPERLTVKPSFANILVWRGLYEDHGHCQVVCVRPGITTGTRILGTSRAPLLRPENLPPPLHTLPPDSTAVDDIRRFRHFSDSWMGQHPDDPHVIGDLRYAMVPDQIRPLWGLALDPTRPGQHGKFDNTFRKTAGQRWHTLWQMITGAR